MRVQACRLCVTKACMMVWTCDSARFPIMCKSCGGAGGWGGGGGRIGTVHVFELLSSRPPRLVRRSEHTKGRKYGKNRLSPIMIHEDQVIPGDLSGSLQLQQGSLNIRVLVGAFDPIQICWGGVVGSDAGQSAPLFRLI